MVFHVRPGTSWATLSRDARLDGANILGTREGIASLRQAGRHYTDDERFQARSMIAESPATDAVDWSLICGRHQVTTKEIVASAPA